MIYRSISVVNVRNITCLILKRVLVFKNSVSYSHKFPNLLGRGGGRFLVHLHIKTRNFLSPRLYWMVNIRLLLYIIGISKVYEILKCLDHYTIMHRCVLHALGQPTCKPNQKQIIWCGRNIDFKLTYWKWNIPCYSGAVKIKCYTSQCWVNIAC